MRRCFPPNGIADEIEMAGPRCYDALLKGASFEIGGAGYERPVATYAAASSVGG